MANSVCLLLTATRLKVALKLKLEDEKTMAQLRKVDKSATFNNQNLPTLFYTRRKE